jgi:orotate phosphoribosyltransferase
MEESKGYKIPLQNNPLVFVRVIPGHYTTSYAHVNYYLDLNDMKSNMLIARDVARELSVPYLSGLAGVPVDTIVCVERTVAVGAYLAEELVRECDSVFNNNGEIHILTPINAVNGNLIFQGSTIKWIAGRNIILLVATISSGQTMKKALECLSFYGGNTIGISTLFLASREAHDSRVHPLFTSDDIPDYRIWEPGDCDMCRSGIRLDAIISSEGYTKI